MSIQDISKKNSHTNNLPEASNTDCDESRYICINKEDLGFYIQCLSK